MDSLTPLTHMYIDLFICILMVWAIYNGWRNGFVKEVFSTLGVIAGLIFSAVIYMLIGNDYLAVNGTETNMVLSIGAFFILWIFIPLIFGFIANMITVAVKGLKLGLPNSLLGMLFSVLKFAILMSCVLNMMSRLGIIDEEKKADSHFYEPALSLLPFIDQETGMTDSLKAKTDTIWVNLTQPKAEAQTQEQN